MKLYGNLTSPFVRKVRVFVHEMGLSPKVELHPSNPFEKDEAFLNANPLSRVPALALDDGKNLVDSAYIVHYLDEFLNEQEKLFPADKGELWEMRQQLVLVDGIIETAVALVFENRRPEDKQIASKKERFQEIIVRTMNILADKKLPLDAARPTALDLTLAVALNYLPFRHPDTVGQQLPSEFKPWLAEMNARESFKVTVPQV